MIACPLLACIAQVAAPTAAVGPGTYHPDRTHAVEVARFALDVTAVTNGDYLEFARANPAWQHPDPLYADGGYLARWRGPLDLGAADPDAPVTGVSWFAARAYCAAQGKRLPTLAEWELASDGTPVAQALDWYARPSNAPPPRVGSTPPDRWGVRDLFGVVWEWVDDFNSVIVDGGPTCGDGAASAVDPADYASFMRSAFRSALEASYTTGNLGFRCAEDLP